MEYWSNYNLYTDTLSNQGYKFLNVWDQNKWPRPNFS